MYKVGIEKYALYSLVGHLGYDYSRGEDKKDEFTEVMEKMISFREMCENVKIKILSSSNQTLFQRLRASFRMRNLLL